MKEAGPERVSKIASQVSALGVGQAHFTGIQNPT